MMNKVLITTPGTSVVLGSDNINSSLAVKALTTNTGLVFLGDSTLASGSNGYPLNAGEMLVFENVGDLDSLYLDAEVPGEGVAWIALNF